jgi:FtsH-binding integral membrane protein
MTTTPDRTSPAQQNALPSTSTSGLLGKVLVLVAVAVGFAAAGAFVGRGLPPVAAFAITLGALGMLLIQALGGVRFRVGPFAVGWLYAVGLAIGLGAGPVLTQYASADPSAITNAAVTTALVVAAMGVCGFTVSKDPAGWMRPLMFAVLALLVLILVFFLTGNGGSPLLSIAIAGISAVLILVDVNYLRRHGTEDDAVLLATGIFVSVVNIFLSLLDLFSRD